MTNFLSTTDLNIDAIIKDAIELKSGTLKKRIDGKVMGMLFFNSSLRTRTSFEVGMYQLGGHGVNLTVGQGMWDLETREGIVMDGKNAEHVKEAIPVLARYVDVLGVRAFPKGKDYDFDRTDPVLSAFAKYSEVPVISMESGLWHPCQALADAMTMREYGVKPRDTVVLSWAYHPKALPMAVANSFMTVAAQEGLNLRVLRPEPFALDNKIVLEAKIIAEKSGGKVVETDDLSALGGAKIVYAKSWGSIKYYGNEKEEKMVRDEYKNWQVDRKWMKKTDNGKFMHCLPVRRNVVVSDDVLDSDTSIVVDQAENRLHAQKSLLLKILGM